MSGTPLVGIVGGYGAVGAAVARELVGRELVGRELVGREALDTPPVRLRIGGRRFAEARRLVENDLYGTGEVVSVDVADPEDLAGFCAGCRIVVNCSGPSRQIADTVARAAFAAGADYIDVGGYDAVYDRLSEADVAVAGRRAVLSAGVLPGLSGMLPRVLALRSPAPPRRLCCYFGGLEHLSRPAATDVLASLHDGFGESFAMWRGGERASGALFEEGVL